MKYTGLQEIGDALAMGKVETQAFKELQHMLLRSVVHNLACKEKAHVVEYRIQYSRHCQAVSSCHLLDP